MQYLVSAFSSFLGFLVGIWGATYLQDRDTRRRHLGIVRALRAELARIRREGGLDAAGRMSIKLFGVAPLLPTPGSWVEALLSDIASTAPEVVTGYLELDRCLNNLAVTEKIADAVHEQARLAGVQKADAERLLANAEIEDIGKALPSVAKADLAIERAAGDVDLGDHVAETSLTQARSALDALDAVLETHEQRLSRGLITHLPWRRQ